MQRTWDLISKNYTFNDIIRSIALAIPWNYHAIHSSFTRFLFLSFFLFLFVFHFNAIVASYVWRERWNSLRNWNNTFHRADQYDRWSASDRKTRFQATLGFLPVHLHTSVFCRSLTKFIRRSFSRVQSRPARKQRRQEPRDVHCNFYDRFFLYRQLTSSRKRRKVEERMARPRGLGEILGSTNGEVSLEYSRRNGLTKTEICSDGNYFSKREKKKSSIQCAVARVVNINQRSIMIESNCMYLYALCIRDYRSIGVYVRTYKR